MVSLHLAATVPTRDLAVSLDLPRGGSLALLGPNATLSSTSRWGNSRGSWVSSATLR